MWMTWCGLSEGWTGTYLRSTWSTSWAKTQLSPSRWKKHWVSIEQQHVPKSKKTSAYNQWETGGWLLKTRANAKPRQLVDQFRGRSASITFSELWYLIQSGILLPGITKATSESCRKKINNVHVERARNCYFPILIHSTFILHYQSNLVKQNKD